MYRKTMGFYTMKIMWGVRFQASVKVRRLVVAPATAVEGDCDFVEQDEAILPNHSPSTWPDAFDVT